MHHSLLRQLIFALVASLAVVLGGCSGGGGGSDSPAPTPSVVTVSGVVTAPYGQVAKLQNKNLFVALFDQIFPAAEASLTGVSVVAGTTVTAVRVDGDGNVVATLGSATTDTGGRYVLRLPAGTALAPTILLRVQGGAVEMRAPAVQTVVDISPATEWLLQQLQNQGAKLDALTNDNLLFLQALIEGYHMTAGGDITTTLTNLSPLQVLIAAEIAAVQNAPTTTTFDGTWVMSGNDIMVGNVSSGDINGIWISGQWLNTLSDYTATLIHAGGNLYNATFSGIESETSQYAHGSGCSTSFTPPYVSGCTFQNYNSTGDGFYEYKSFGPVSGTQQIFALDDGRMVLPYATQENVEAGDIFGYVTPAYAEVLMPMGGTPGAPDAYAGIATWPSYAYALTNDGHPDRSQLRGGGADMKPMALIKKGSGLGNSTLNGRYAYIALNHDIWSDGDRHHSVFFGSFAASNGAVSNGTINGAQMSRVVDNSSTVTLGGAAIGASITDGSYAVSSDGALTLNLTTDALNQPPAMSGRVNGAGNFFYASASETSLASTPYEVIHTAVFGIKVDTATPSLSGKSFRFRGAELEYDSSAKARYGHLAYSTLTFNGDSTVSITVNSQAIERTDDITAIVSQPAVVGESITTATYTTGPNGAFTIDLGDGTLVHGFVNAKSLLAVQQRGFPASGAASITNGDVGIVMGHCIGTC